MEKPKHLNHVSEKEFGFFVRLTVDRYEGGSRTTDNSYESLVCNTHNPKLCWCVGVEPAALDNFLKTWQAAYQYVECVYVPENSLYTIEEINEKLNFSGEEKSEIEQMRNENESLKDRLAELEKTLAESGVIKKNTKKQ